MKQNQTVGVGIVGPLWNTPSQHVAAVTLPWLGTCASHQIDTSGIFHTIAKSTYHCSKRSGLCRKMWKHLKLKCGQNPAIHTSCNLYPKAPLYNIIIIVDTVNNIAILPLWHTSTVTNVKIALFENIVLSLLPHVDVPYALRTVWLLRNLIIIIIIMAGMAVFTWLATS